MSDKYRELLAVLQKRLREPSTYAGIAVIVAAVTHSTVPDATVQHWAEIGIGIAALIAVVFP